MNNAVATWLITPDEKRIKMATIPSTRNEVLKLLRRQWSGKGEYAVVEEISDPISSSIDLNIFSFFGYDKNNFGMILHSHGCGIPMIADDVSKYLNSKIISRNNWREIELNLDVYEGCQEDHVAWLCMEDHGGTEVAEFGFVLTNRVMLPDCPDTHGGHKYILEVPTVGLLFRFVHIASKLLKCGNVKFRSFSLNQRSDNWFA
ncbi:hypothetical protein HFQ13_09410 [Acidithiobacillus sp. VAN18-1]|uniref:Uncharacterized protein n=1 Tax=Igneacidithiobacillus copahuensis TaxID=2724909 RepID=A0AAE2YQY9_9PROT|nr:hypothetical protein [Igneacidithiobacillus copahuensis]MBU2788413.1 hypothetical protein [Igneacidithiobacillus copahuensis]MBU2796918.1 hypothetical protein [Acidithiobacillus sp. VAN18-2]